MARDYKTLSKRFCEISDELDKDTCALIADCLLTIYQYEECIGCCKEAMQSLQKENTDLKANLAFEKTKEEP